MSAVEAAAILTYPPIVDGREDTPMKNCPFTMSQDVADWFESALSMSEKEPSLSGKSSLLIHALGYNWLDSIGALLNGGRG